MILFLFFKYNFASCGAAQSTEPDGLSLSLWHTMNTVIYQSGDVTCCAVSKLGRRSHKDGHSERQDGNNADHLSNTAPPLRGAASRTHVCQKYSGTISNV